MLFLHSKKWATCRQRLEFFACCPEWISGSNVIRAGEGGISSSKCAEFDAHPNRLPNRLWQAWTIWFADEWKPRLRPKSNRPPFPNGSNSLPLFICMLIQSNCACWAARVSDAAVEKKRKSWRTDAASGGRDPEKTIRIQTQPANWCADIAERMASKWPRKGHIPKQEKSTCVCTFGEGLWWALGTGPDVNQPSHCCNRPHQVSASKQHCQYAAVHLRCSIRPAVGPQMPRSPRQFFWLIPMYQSGWPCEPVTSVRLFGWQSTKGSDVTC